MAPAPGPDGHRAVIQPDGRIVETYATIVLSSGQVVALSYSVTDPSSSGDGWQNGQTASMLPNYAGQLDDVEIANGVNHAIAITVPAEPGGERRLSGLRIRPRREDGSAGLFRNPSYGQPSHTASLVFHCFPGVENA